MTMQPHCYSCLLFHHSKHRLYSSITIPPATLSPQLTDHWYLIQVEMWDIYLIYDTYLWWLEWKTSPIGSCIGTLSPFGGTVWKVMAHLGGGPLLEGVHQEGLGRFMGLPYFLFSPLSCSSPLSLLFFCFLISQLPMTACGHAFPTMMDFYMSGPESQNKLFPELLFFRPSIIKTITLSFSAPRSICVRVCILHSFS